MSRRIVVVQHLSLVSSILKPLSLLWLPQTLHDLQLKLSIDSLTTRNKLMMNDTLQDTFQKSLMFHLAKSQLTCCDWTGVRLKLKVTVIFFFLSLY
jgi:hypothetical protein